MIALWKKFVKWQPFGGKFGAFQFFIVVITVIVFRLIVGI